MIGWIFDQASAWLDAFTRDTLNRVWALLAATLFHVPDVTGLPQVAALSAHALAVVNTGFVIVIMIVGVVAMTRDTVQSQYGVAQLAPRLVIGFVAANFATPICQALTTTANAVVEALTGQGIASDRSLSALLRVVTNALTDPGATLLVTLIGLTIVVLLVLLLVGWIVRFVALIIAVGVAPMALACHALPWTDPIAQLWWRTMGGLSITVVLQAIALHVSLSIFLDPAANLPSYGLPSDPTGLLNLFIVAVLLWATVRIPSLVRQHLTHAHTRPNLAATIVRFVVVQQLTRGLATGLRGVLGGATRSRPRALGPGGRGGPGGGMGTAGGRGGGGRGGPGLAPAGGSVPRRPAPPGSSSSGTAPSGRRPSPHPTSPAAPASPTPATAPTRSPNQTPDRSPKPAPARSPSRVTAPHVPGRTRPPVISAPPSRVVPAAVPRRPARPLSPAATPPRRSR